MAIRSPCSTTSQKAVLWANTKKCYEFAQKRIYRCLSLRGCGLPHQCAHWFAMTCKRRVRVSECKAVGREGKCIDGGSFAWYNVLAYADTPHVSACHCEERSDVAIRSPCSTTSQKAVPWANTQPSYEFAQPAANLPGISAGTRIATPVCALARNDMLKTDALLRMQGGGARVLPRKVLANADTRQVSACRCELRSCNRRNGFPSACHCEERSDVAIRSPCSTTSQKAVLWANTKKCYEFAQTSAYLPGISAGTRIATPLKRTGSQ